MTCMQLQKPVVKTIKVGAGLYLDVPRHTGFPDSVKGRRDLAHLPLKADPKP